MIVPDLHRRTARCLVPLDIKVSLRYGITSITLTVSSCMYPFVPYYGCSTSEWLGTAGATIHVPGLAASFSLSSILIIEAGTVAFICSENVGKDGTSTLIKLLIPRTSSGVDVESTGLSGCRVGAR